LYFARGLLGSDEFGCVWFHLPVKFFIYEGLIWFVALAAVLTVILIVLYLGGRAYTDFRSMAMKECLVVGK